MHKQSLGKRRSVKRGLSSVKLGLGKKSFGKKSLGKKSFGKLIKTKFRSLTKPSTADLAGFMTAIRNQEPELEKMIKLMVNSRSKVDAIFEAHPDLKGADKMKIMTMVKLKEEEGFIDYYSYRIVKDYINELITTEQIETIIRLKREGFNDYYSYTCVKEFTNEQIEYLIRLKKAGFNDYFSYVAIKYKTNEQIETAINLKKQGYTKWDAYSAA